MICSDIHANLYFYIIPTLRQTFSTLKILYITLFGSSSSSNRISDLISGKIQYQLDSNKRLCHCRGTARCVTSENSCHVSQGMGLRKVSNSKSNLQGHSRTLAMVPFDRPYMIPY